MGQLLGIRHAWLPKVFTNNLVLTTLRPLVLLSNQLLSDSFSPLLSVSNGPSGSLTSPMPFFMDSLKRRSLCSSPLAMLILIILLMYASFTSPYMGLNRLPGPGLIGSHHSYCILALWLPWQTHPCSFINLTIPPFTYCSMLMISFSQATIPHSFLISSLP